MDRDKPENQEEKALTCIHHAYTLFDTPEPDSNGTESLMVKNFLDTLKRLIDDKERLRAMTRCG